MIGLLETNKKAIAAICQKYGVKKLDVFGSAATGAFHATSDLDFVVEFADYGPGIATRFIDFADELERFFGRSVDLVFDAKLTNPYFRQSVNATRELVFDASGDSEAVA
jgi:predicted nucleotidyltransferase